MKKIGLLCLALVLALGTMGIGYSLWYQTVYVNGTVQTGSVDMCIEDGNWLQLDGGPDHTATTSCETGAISGIGFVPEEKEVGWTEISRPDCYTLEVTVHNAYPCYYNVIDFAVDNTGTIPVKLWKAVVTTDYDEYTFYDDFWQCLDLDGDGNNDLWLRWGDSWGNQREPGGHYDLSFDFHVLQPAPQGPDTTLTFTVELYWVQWNEYVAGPIT
jgi:hypothetical protein